MRRFLAMVLAMGLLFGGLASASDPAGVTVSGSTRLQLRSDTLGLVTVSLTGPGYAASTVAASDGAWAIPGVPAGDYTLRADAPNYLSAQRSLTVTDADVALAGQNVLLVGDLNGSGFINVADISGMVSNFNKGIQGWP